MKKSLALLLVLAMALSLAACGGETSNEAVNPYPEYEYINEMLANGNYEGAMNAVEQLYYQAHAQDEVPPPPLGDPSDEEREQIWEYIDTVQRLELYLENGYINWYDNETSTNYDDSEALRMCYEKLQELESMDEWLKPDIISYYFGLEDFNCDRLGLLAQFTILKDVKLKQTTTTQDNMGNISDSTNLRCYYDASGVLIKVYDSPDWSVRNLFHNDCTGEYTISYDAAGNMTQKRYGSGDSVSALITYDYENGRIVTETLKTNSGETVYTYGYDEAGRLATIDWKYSESYPYQIVCTYDEAGRLVKQEKICTYIDGEYTWVENKHIMEYTYDGNGHLTSGTYTYQSWSRNWGNKENYVNSEQVNTYTYTCDAQGREISAILIPGDRVDVYGDDAGNVLEKPSYTQKTIETLYGDYYVFAPSVG